MDLVLNEEKIYDLSQAAISEGIKPADVDSQVTHILNQLITPWSLDEWRSETVFVNRRGEVIERRPVLARYRDVPLIETTLAPGQFPQTVESISG